MCGPCNSLVMLYTLRLPELLPRLATPDVEVYAAHWQVGVLLVRAPGQKQHV